MGHDTIYDQKVHWIAIFHSNPGGQQENFLVKFVMSRPWVIMGCPRNLVHGQGLVVIAIPETKQSPISTIHLSWKHAETVTYLLYEANNFQPSSIYFILRTAHSGTL